jgi:hypothetical protein
MLPHTTPKLTLLSLCKDILKQAVTDIAIDACGGYVSLKLREFWDKTENLRGKRIVMP